MEAISFSSPKAHFPFNLSNSSSLNHSLFVKLHSRPFKPLLLSSPSSRNPPLRSPPPVAVAEALEGSRPDSSAASRSPPRGVDKSGRFCSPRAARELALMIAYAACLEGSDPVRLFDKRVNAKRETGYVFDEEWLSQYDHMSFGGAPVEVGTQEEAEELILKNDKDSSNEAAVLSAPPKLVYNRFVLRMNQQQESWNFASCTLLWQR
ncbi:uncharacterized protein M6B38_203875 [Iris pallida]|uniref:Uncharacterized protein n=1 Tax=Iris pallida TaxID=29817 RepID=A0AAX6E7F0_IRIPA|nr:uncharacterized protein M6B38_203875 [Iris pallida]